MKRAPQQVILFLFVLGTENRWLCYSHCTYLRVCLVGKKTRRKEGGEGISGRILIFILFGRREKRRERKI